MEPSAVIDSGGGLAAVPSWILRWVRAIVPVSSEPLFRVGVSHCDAVECAVAPRPMRRLITAWIVIPSAHA